MKHTVETTCLVDEKGIEVLATWHKEDGGIILDSVEVVIAGRGVDITTTLRDNQIDHICEEINETI